MVEIDPDTEEFYWVSENETRYYNVTFLDDKVSHAWIPASFVCSFLKPPRKNGYLNRKYNKNKCTEFIEAAEKKAKTALTMSIKERLKNFSFVHRYEGKWPQAENLDDDTTNHIYIKEVEDIESLKSFDSDATDNSNEQSTINKMMQQFNNREQLYTEDKPKCNVNKKSEFSTGNLESETKQEDICLSLTNKKPKGQPLKKLSGNTGNNREVEKKIVNKESCLEVTSIPEKAIQNKINKISKRVKSTTNELKEIPINKNKPVSKNSNFQVEVDRMEEKGNGNKNIVISQQSNKLKKNDESGKDLKGIENLNKVINQNTKSSFKTPIKDNKASNQYNKKKIIKHTDTEYSDNMDKCIKDFNLEDKKRNCVHGLSTNPIKTEVKSKQDIGQIRNIDLKNNNDNMEHGLSTEDKTANQEILQRNLKGNKRAKNKSKITEKTTEKTESKPTNKKVLNEEKLENKISKQDIGQVQSVEAIIDHIKQIKIDLKSSNENMENNVLDLEDKVVNKENKTVKNSEKSKTTQKVKTEEKSKPNKKMKNEEKTENKISKQDIGQVQNIEKITDHTTQNKTNLKRNFKNVEHNVLYQDKIVNKENLENKTAKNSNKIKENKAKIKEEIKHIPTNKKMKNSEKSENKILNILEKNLNSSREIEPILNPVTTSSKHTENKQIEVISLSDDENTDKISKKEKISYSLSLNFNTEQSENEDSDSFEVI